MTIYQGSGGGGRSPTAAAALRRLGCLGGHGHETPCIFSQVAPIRASCSSISSARRFSRGRLHWARSAPGDPCAARSPPANIERTNTAGTRAWPAFILIIIEPPMALSQTITIAIPATILRTACVGKPMGMCMHPIKSNTYSVEGWIGVGLTLTFKPTEFKGVGHKNPSDRIVRISMQIIRLNLRIWRDVPPNGCFLRPNG